MHGPARRWSNSPTGRGRRSDRSLGSPCQVAVWQHHFDRRPRLRLPCLPYVAAPAPVVRLPLDQVDANSLPLNDLAISYPPGILTVLGLDPIPLHESQVIILLPVVERVAGR